MWCPPSVPSAGPADDLSYALSTTDNNTSSSLIRDDGGESRGVFLMGHQGREWTVSDPAQLLDPAALSSSTSWGPSALDTIATYVSSGSQGPLEGKGDVAVLCVNGTTTAAELERQGPIVVCGLEPPPASQHVTGRPVRTRGERPGALMGWAGWLSVSD